MRWTSDPEGSVQIRVDDVTLLNRYRFGTQTADFLICRRCGSLVAAVTRGEPQQAVVNIDVLERRDEFPQPVQKDFEGEAVEARVARRANGWMPASLISNTRHGSDTDGTARR